MTKTEEIFVIQKLEGINSLRYQDNFIIDSDKLSKKELDKILSSGEPNGSSMLALAHFFDIFLSKYNTKKNSVFSLFNDKYIGKMEYENEGKNSKIYSGLLFSKKLPIIIKTFKETFPSSHILREFLLGYVYINKLRNKVPNFVFTYGSLKLSSELSKENQIQKQTIILEKIEGEPLGVLISQNSISFEDWLNIFCQVLLSLEVAQQEIGFTHFDLHCLNIIIKKVSSENQLLLGDKIYKISFDMLPIIIDFGTSCIRENNFFLGNRDYAKYGMFNFMIAGNDMYKLIVSSLSYCKNKSLFSSISSLLKFYDSKEPYCILADKNGFEVASSEFCQKVSVSSVASFTPLMFLEWIAKNYNIDCFIKTRERNVLRLPMYDSIYISFSSLLSQEYQAIELFSSMSKNFNEGCKSFLMCSYANSLLDNTIRYLKSVSRHKIKLGKLSILNKKCLKQIDRLILEQYFKVVKAPNDEELKIVISDIVNLRLLHYCRKTKIDICGKFDSVIEFETVFLKYLDLYYIILELKLKGVYKNWCERFKVSIPYQFYFKYYLVINQAKRWVKTLKSTIFLV